MHAMELPAHSIEGLSAAAPTLSDHVAADPDAPGPRLGVDDHHARRPDDQVIDVGFPAGRDEIVQPPDAASTLRLVVEPSAQVRLAVAALPEACLPLGRWFRRVAAAPPRRRGPVRHATRAGTGLG